MSTDESKRIIANMVFKSKIMSQEGGQPLEFKGNNQKTTTYFTFRTTTDALTNFGLTYRASAIRQKINYFSDTWWLDKLPYVSPIEQMVGKSEPQYEVITYEFQSLSTAFTSKEKIVERDEFGYYALSLSQNELEH